MTLTEIQKFQLKKFVRELESYRGRHTELVTVYVPTGYDINKVINHLSQEQGTATNIKSASTRKNVIAALERMIQHLRLFKRTPEHGLAAFSGNVAEREGHQNIKVWSIEPPVPLKTRIYRCDKEFVLDLLRDMLEVKNVYGLVVMDRKEGTFGLLKGKTIVPVARAKSNVPGKTRAGGQSAQRFERLRDGAAKDFYKKLGMIMKDQFFELKNLKGIIVGGPGPTKYDWVDGNFITNELKKKIIATKDITYTDEFGLQELIEKAQDVLAEEDIASEKEIMKKFFQFLATKPKMVSYGEAEVMKNLNNGAVGVLLLSEILDEKLISRLEEEAGKMSTEVRIISVETREGVQLKEMGKIAAILRYETE